MDGLAMALHVLYTTNNFKEAILKGVNLCGDADSVGSIIGQIAGAFYGMDSIPEEWIKTVNNWDNNEISLRGYLLCHLEIKTNNLNYIENVKENREKCDFTKIQKLCFIY